MLFCFLDAQPTDGEREVWNQISAVLQDSESMLADLQAYKGAGQEIRDVCLLKLMTVLWKQNQAKLDVFLASVLYPSTFYETIQKSSLKLYLENMLQIMCNVEYRALM